MEMRVRSECLLPSISSDSYQGNRPRSHPSCEEIDGKILRKEEEFTYGVH